MSEFKRFHEKNYKDFLDQRAVREQIQSRHVLDKEMISAFESILSDAEFEDLEYLPIDLFKIEHNGIPGDIAIFLSRKMKHAIGIDLSSPADLIVYYWSTFAISTSRGFISKPKYKVAFKKDWENPKVIKATLSILENISDLDLSSNKTIEEYLSSSISRDIEGSHKLYELIKQIPYEDEDILISEPEDSLRIGIFSDLDQVISHNCASYRELSLKDLAHYVNDELYAYDILERGNCLICSAKGYESSNDEDYQEKLLNNLLLEWKSKYDRSITESMLFLSNIDSSEVLYNNLNMYYNKRFIIIYNSNYILEDPKSISILRDFLSKSHRSSRRSRIMILTSKDRGEILDPILSELMSLDLEYIRSSRENILRSSIAMLSEDEVDRENQFSLNSSVDLKTISCILDYLITHSGIFSRVLAKKSDLSCIGRDLVILSKIYKIVNIEELSDYLT